METGAPAEAPSSGSIRGGQLRRVVSSNMLLVFVLGDVIGAGIYVLVGQVAARVGGAIWTAFALALALAMFTACAYAELATKYPHAGGAGLYVNKAFRRSFVTFLVAFAVMSSGITSAATLATAFAGDYLREFVALDPTVAALGLLALVTLVNLRGISESVKLNVVLTAIEVSGLVLICVIAAAALGAGHGDPGRAFQFKPGEPIPLAILSGAALAFYALIGFEDSANLAEETRDPSHAYPRALFGGLAIAGVIYIAVSILASMVVPTQTLAQSSGPLLEVVKAGPLAVPTRLFSGIALFAIVNGALINLIMASRLTYGMSREGIVPQAFSRVLPGRHTPWVGIAFTALLCAVLIVIGDLGRLAETTVTLLLGAFILVNVSVLVLRRDPVDHDHFRAPSAVPVIGVAICAGLLTQRDGRTFLLAGSIMLLGVVLYAISRGLGLSRPG